MCILSVVKIQSISKGELMNLLYLGRGILNAGQARINRCNICAALIFPGTCELDSRL